jgi:hypothetical protein
MNNLKTETLISVYMTVYNDFAVNPSDIMKSHDMTREVALKHLKALEARGLVCFEFTDGKGGFFGNDSMARKRTVGLETIWQCLTTYDSENESEALERVTAALK